MAKYYVQDEYSSYREVEYSLQQVIFTHNNGEKRITDTGNGIMISSVDSIKPIILDYCDMADLIIAFHILQDQGQRLWHGTVVRGRQIVNVPIARRKK